MWLQHYRELNGGMKWAVDWEAWDNEWQFRTGGKPTYPGHFKHDIRKEMKLFLDNELLGEGEPSIYNSRGAGRKL